MNKLIKQQLEKTQLVDLSHFDPNTNTYHIPQRKTMKLEEDDYYILKLKPEFLNDTVIRDNWNRGFTPPFLQYKVEIEKVMGRMVKISGVATDDQGNDLDSFWTGWISTDYIEFGIKI